MRTLAEAGCKVEHLLPGRCDRQRDSVLRPHVVPRVGAASRRHRSYRSCRYKNHVWPDKDMDLGNRASAPTHRAINVAPAHSDGRSAWIFALHGNSSMGKWMNAFGVAFGFGQGIVGMQIFEMAFCQIERGIVLGQQLAQTSRGIFDIHQIGAIQARKH